MMTTAHVYTDTNNFVGEVDESEAVEDGFRFCSSDDKNKEYPIKKIKYRKRKKHGFIKSL